MKKKENSTLILTKYGIKINLITMYLNISINYGNIYDKQSGYW